MEVRFVFLKTRRFIDMGMVGMMVGMGNPYVNVTTVKNRKSSATRTVQKSKASAKKLKRLQYNFKQISTQILTAQTSSIARTVTVRARAKLAMLHRLHATGQYDETELYHAIIHAGKMVRIAKKRTNHLREEERAEKQGSCSVEMEKELEDTENVEEAEEEYTKKEREIQRHEQELMELQEEYEELMQEVMEESMENITGLDDMADELLGTIQIDMSPEDLERLKKKHRADEMREVMEADMKYLKALMFRLEREKQEGSSSGVSLQLSGVDMPVQSVSVDIPVDATTEPLVVAEGGSIDISV